MNVPDGKIQEDWRSIKEASELSGVKAGKISRLVMQGRIKSKKNLRDERQRLVDVIEIRKMFSEE